MQYNTMQCNTIYYNTLNATNAVPLHSTPFYRIPIHEIGLYRVHVVLFHIMQSVPLHTLQIALKWVPVVLLISLLSSCPCEANNHDDVILMIVRMDSSKE